MTVEVVNNITDLNSALPGANDDPSEGDDHIRNIKKALLADFANINAPVTATPTQLNNIGLQLISTATASSSASVSFTSGIDSTYDEYELHILNAVPATNAVTAEVRVATSGPTWVSTGYFAMLNNGATGNIAYLQVSNASVVSSVAASGGITAVIKLFTPSSTTAGKAFLIQSSYANTSAGFDSLAGGGYVTTTSAIIGIQFLFSAGNIASGSFKLYGVKK